MWAYGLVLYEMIALSPPHVENNEEPMNTSNDSMLECSIMNSSNENNDPNSDLEDSFIMSLKDPDDSKYGIF